MTFRAFVTGTDTGVGKTEVSTALLRGLVRAGEEPFAFKPYESGVSARRGPTDAKALREAGGSWQPLDSVCLHTFEAPLAPAIAARQEGRTVSWQRVRSGFFLLGSGSGVVEGAGGLHVPVDEKRDVIDVIDALELPVVLVARAGLGTINHTTLSLRSLAARHLRVAAVVLVQTSAAFDPSIPGNKPFLSRRFPRVPFLGPVPFLRAVKKRRAAFDRVVAPLLASRI